MTAWEAVRLGEHPDAVPRSTPVNSPLTAAARVGPVLPAGDPRIVGIVNLAEDSFSDGGRYLDPRAAIVHTHRLRAEGADAIELGPAASHPGSVPVTAAEEQRRLAPVLEQLAADGIPVWVDSFRPETQRFALSAGVPCLNDIHGFGDPDTYPALAASGCQLIVMHAVQATGPATRVVTDPAAVWDGTRRFFARRLAALREAGISEDRLIIDPGLGYFLGSTPGPSLKALGGIRELKAAFGVPVLVSPSRKSFLHALTGRDVTRSGPATLAAEIFAAWQGADYIRTHDVAAARDAFTVLAAIASEAAASREAALLSRIGRSSLQHLPDVDAVTVRVGEYEATQSVVGVAQALDDPDPVRSQMIMEAGRIGHHEVRGVVAAALVAFNQGQVQLGRVPLENHEPDGIAVDEGHRHPQDVPVAAERARDVAYRDRGGNTAEGGAGPVRAGVGHLAP